MVALRKSLNPHIECRWGINDFKGGLVFCRNRICRKKLLKIPSFGRGTPSLFFQISVNIYFFFSVLGLDAFWGLCHQDGGKKYSYTSLKDQDF